jgi:hypothetical protein
MLDEIKGGKSQERGLLAGMILHRRERIYGAAFAEVA